MLRAKDVDHYTERNTLVIKHSMREMLIHYLATYVHRNFQNGNIITSYLVKTMQFFSEPSFPELKYRKNSKILHSRVVWLYSVRRNLTNYLSNE